MASRPFFAAGPSMLRGRLAKGSISLSSLIASFPIKLNKREPELTGLTDLRCPTDCRKRTSRFFGRLNCCSTVSRMTIRSFCLPLHLMHPPRPFQGFSFVPKGILTSTFWSSVAVTTLLECLVWVGPFDKVNVSCNGRERASPHSMSPLSAPKQVGSLKVCMEERARASPFLWCSWFKSGLSPNTGSLEVVQA